MHPSHPVFSWYLFMYNSSRSGAPTYSTPPRREEGAAAPRSCLDLNFCVRRAAVRAGTREVASRCARGIDFWVLTAVQGYLNAGWWCCSTLGRDSTACTLFLAVAHTGERTPVRHRARQTHTARSATTAVISFTPDFFQRELSFFRGDGCARIVAEYILAS